MADVFRHVSRIDGFFSKKGKKTKKNEKKGLHFPKSRDILSNVPSEQVNTKRGISTVGSALHSHCRGQRFESAMLHHSSGIVSHDDPASFSSRRVLTDSSTPTGGMIMEYPFTTTARRFPTPKCLQTAACWYMGGLLRQSMVYLLNYG